MLAIDPEHEKARAICLRYLSYRARTVWEMRQRLAKDDFEEDVVETTINWLKGLGYINDRQFADDWVRFRGGSRGIGPRRLRHELMQKGVDAAIVQEVLADMDEADELTSATDVVSTRFQRMKQLPPDVVRRRLYGFLQRRGFSSSVIRRAVDEVMNPSE